MRKRHPNAPSLEEGPRTISWTEERTIAVGYHNCDVCGVETPEPTSAQMLEYAQSHNVGGTMWPGSEAPGCMPAGWTQDYGTGLICPDCTAAKEAAFATRRKAAQEAEGSP